MSMIDAETMGLSALRQLLDERHSVRGFLPDSVDPGIIEQMLAAAQRTPSWCNVQPWQVIITRGAATHRFRKALSEYAATHGPSPDFGLPLSYNGVHRDRRRQSGFALYESVGIARGDREASAKQTFENFRLFGAPHAAIVTTERDLGVYGAIDCGAYLSSLLLAAQSLGVAAIPQAALAMHPGFIRTHFGLPENRLVVFGVSFGFEDVAHPANAIRIPRASLEEAVTVIEQ
jgi:nitroreductase